MTSACCAGVAAGGERLRLRALDRRAGVHERHGLDLQRGGGFDVHAIGIGAGSGPLSRGARARRMRGTVGAVYRIMGVVNVTPDSFSDGGAFLDRDAAVGHGLRLAFEGADLLDVGGESTRPGADPVSERDELARVIPVIEGIRAGNAARADLDRHVQGRRRGGGAGRRRPTTSTT